MTEIRIADIDSSTVHDLLLGCKSCLYWEYPERFDGSFPDDNARLKQRWFEAMIEQFGPCGKLLYVNDEPAGYCQYITPDHIPGISRYEGLLQHVDKDAVFITCLCMSEGYQRQGLAVSCLRMSSMN